MIEIERLMLQVNKLIFSAKKYSHADFKYLTLIKHDTFVLTNDF